MAERKAIPKKTRFEVLKRDKFTCQYCGRQAPDVVLNIDHITPIAKGGTNEITNLITSCFDCNSGKSDRELSDDAVVKKQKAQLDMIQERREQLEMMHEWQMQLTDEMISVGDIVSDIIRKMTGVGLTDSGKKDVSALVQQFGLAEVCDATRLAFSKYPTNNDAQIRFAFKKIGGICYCRTHRTCYQCRHYDGSGYAGKHLCELRVDDNGTHISFYSVKDAEKCECFEEKSK